ncbi:thermonuclease family protein [Roseospirillum parvum]|uniref:Endonuclease YncB, thermonuclease family n=1 Tax=Roseospirillum parvum TaxID=83401 RepID=A0A1G7TLT6_9PROT|nr:thermonuclease family protein [Roseospirillum parvum]SDG36072.1 Endonuclease YncB, thermonuclease family [Roseospirillum parvum]
MRRAVVVLCALLLLAAPAKALSPQDLTPQDLTPQDLTPGEPGVVARVLDGDTVDLDDGRRVRLLAIQAPEMNYGRGTPEPFAEAATAALVELAEGRRVTPHFDRARHDRHGRLLAHLVRADGLWLEAELIDRGLARVYTFADNRALGPALLRREAAARQARRGLWADSRHAIRAATAVARLLGEVGTFQLVEGTVRDAARVRDHIYLNFGPDWRTDFTVRVDEPAWPLFQQAFRGLGVDLLALEGRTVRARGWLRNRNGPMLVLDHPERLEVVE